VALTGDGGDDARMDAVRTLVITAHPDDVDFGAAGTIALWAEAGEAVTYCVVTDGDNGGFDPAVPRSDIGAIRRAEQQAAAEAVGVTDVRFLGYRDGSVTPSLELRRDVSRVIRELRPHRVLTHSPERNWDFIHASHPDHLAVGEAVACAVYPDARNPFAFVGQPASDLDDWAVDEVWIPMGPDAADTIDISATVDRKMQALLCHSSQHKDPEALVERMRAWWQSAAEANGLPAGSSCEVFRVVDTR
jgi:LmbE family N-acetylglucosaminyl deacetylase